MKNIEFSKPLINTKEVIRYTKKILLNNFPNEGEATKLFQKKIKKVLKSRYVVTTTSGTSAIFLALKSINVQNNDEVIVPNITFPATANAVRMAGAKLVLVDINPNNLLIDIDSLKKKISKNTKAVIPVHVSGRGGNIKEIIKICKRKKIKVIEDAAEAFGSKHKKKYLGNFGDFGCFSFAPNKIITTGQGGVVVTGSKTNYQKMLKIKDQGRIGPTTGGADKHVIDGFNLKFTNLQAALGISQLNTFNKRIKKLNEIHNYYKKNLIKNKKFKLFNFDQKHGELPLWSDIYCLDRNKLYNYLKKRKVICRLFWLPLNTLKPYKKSKKHFRNSHKLLNKLMWLPSPLALKTKDQKKICNLINNFYRK